MALTLAQGAQLRTSPAFRDRVRMAMGKAAVDVSNESQGTLTSNAWIKRQQLASRIMSSPDAFLESFVLGVTADPGLSLSWFAPVSIVSSTSANPIVITATAHGLTTGQIVEIAGHLVNTNAAGSWPVTVLTSNTFSIPQAGNGVGGATGTVQRQMSDGDINFTVNSTVSTNLFSAIAGLTHEERGQ